MSALAGRAHSRRRRCPAGGGSPARGVCSTHPLQTTCRRVDHPARLLHPRRHPPATRPPLTLRSCCTTTRSWPPLTWPPSRPLETASTQARARLACPPAQPLLKGWVLGSSPPRRRRCKHSCMAPHHPRPPMPPVTVTATPRQAWRAASLTTFCGTWRTLRAASIPLKMQTAWTPPRARRRRRVVGWGGVWGGAGTGSVAMRGSSALAALVGPGTLRLPSHCRAGATYGATTRLWSCWVRCAVLRHAALRWRCCSSPCPLMFAAALGPPPRMPLTTAAASPHCAHRRGGRRVLRPLLCQTEWQL